MKYTEKDYIESGFYGDDSEELENYKSKVVKCRKVHMCMGGCNTEIQAKEYAFCETGFMYGSPVSSYTCLPCIDKWIDELKEEEEYEDGNESDEESK